MNNHEPFQSKDWYRVARMRPRLRVGVKIAFEEIRQETWYLIGDPLSGGTHRFNSLGYQILAACDGERTLDEIWETIVAASGNNAPSQDKTIHIIAKAFKANLLMGNIAPDAASLVKTQKKLTRKRKQSHINPISFKVPLWDPNDYLDANVLHWQWLFTSKSLKCISSLLLLGVLLVLINLSEYLLFSKKALLQSHMLLILWILYPLIKFIHEMAHAWAVKAFGGEVHEIGITLLMLSPIPYVDASAASGFASKYQRAIVSAAGIIAELSLATLALILWLFLEPGLLKNIAFAIVLIGGVSTLLINGNPLLRFDGYHILCDLFELPNLAQRSINLWQHLSKRYLLGLQVSPFEGHARGALPWLLAYAPLSWVYKTVLLALMCVWLADINSFWGGVGLCMLLWISVITPGYSIFHYVFADDELQQQRIQALSITASITAAVIALLFGIKLPYQTNVPGVVWLQEDAFVRLGTDGFVEELLVQDGQKVVQGQVLMRLSNDELNANFEQIKAQLKRHEIERASNFVANAMQTSLVDEETVLLTEQLQNIQKRLDQLLVRAQTNGQFVIPAQFNAVGKYLAQGETVAHVIAQAPPLVRILVRNEDLAQVQSDTRKIRVQLAHLPDLETSGELISHSPLISKTLPSRALGDRFGGPIPQDTNDSTGKTTQESFFQFDIQLHTLVKVGIGARSLVTIEHSPISAASLIGQFIRRSFLRHFEK